VKWGRTDENVGLEIVHLLLKEMDKPGVRGEHASGTVPGGRLQLNEVLSKWSRSMTGAVRKY
jgi:hypothetical protein